MNLKPFTFLLLAFVTFACNADKKMDADASEPKSRSGAPLKPLALADLPDSLLPKTVYLRDMPEPIVVQVPGQAGGSYSFTNSRGEVQVVRLEPPASTALPVLQDEYGAPVRSDSGRPYVLGEGGKSNFTSFTTDNGLALDGVICSAIDQFGNLWFGTFGGGVSRYDGHSFTTFTTSEGLASNSVWSIREDHLGHLWFGTQGGGVSRYDGRSFESFTTADGLAADIVLCITEDKNGTLWFGTAGGGVSSYKREDSSPEVVQFTNYDTESGLGENTVRSIVEDEQGGLWFATDGGGVSRFDGEKFTSYSTDDGLASNLVLSIAEDKHGDLWFGTWGEGVSRCNGKLLGNGEAVFTTYTTAQGLANNSVRSIEEDRNGNLWFATEGGGVSKYDGRTMTTYTTANGLANNLVLSITEDRGGSLWFGTYGGGVSRYDGAAIVNFSTGQGLANNTVWSITEDRLGNLWFGTAGDGVSRFNGRAKNAETPGFTNFSTSQGLANNIVCSILEDKSGNLWFGTEGTGMSCYDGQRVASGSGRFTSYNAAHGLGDNIVWAIAEDRVGNLWFGTGGGGVTRYDGQLKSADQASFTTFTTTQGLAHNVVRTITEDKAGHLWFGTESGGVSRFDGQSMDDREASFVNFNTAHGLTNNNVMSILEDSKGNLWFGTDGGGVSRLSWEVVEGLSEIARGEGAITFDNLTTTEGLANDVVYDIEEDKLGNIVIGTNLGFTVIPASAAAQPFSEVRAALEYYNAPAGYPIKDVNTNAMFCDSEGLVWAGTGNEKTALVRFDYGALHQSDAPPLLVLQNVKINEDDICWHHLQTRGVHANKADSATARLQGFLAYGSVLSQAENDSILAFFGNISFDGIAAFYPIPERLVLPYRHNHITFDFNAIETGKPQLVNYQYMLVGYDKGWSPVLKRTDASFGNIYEGRYTFKVRAQGPNGVWSEPLSYSFRVLPPWYRSWWAYAIYALVLAVFIWRIHLAQKARTIRIEREKTKDRELSQARQIEKAYMELKATQAQLIQAEKMASLGELTAGIAHEIQNPLNFVNNFSEVSSELLLEMKQEFDNGSKEEGMAIADDVIVNLAKISHHGKRADAIVKGMLAHSRVGKGEKLPTDINALADEYLKLSYHGLRAKDKTFNADFKTDFDPALPKVIVVPQDIGRVLLNLINNAFQACSGQDRSGLENLTGQGPLVTVSTRNLGNKIEISVRDNGPGIPDSIKDKIFQPFFTTKPTGQGTGLGLSLSYDIAKAHGGAIEVLSKENEGTTFTISLPL